MIIFNRTSAAICYWVTVLKLLLLDRSLVLCASTLFYLAVFTETSDLKSFYRIFSDLCDINR